MDKNIQIEWYNPRQVQEVYGFSTSTLAKWRMDNINISFSRMGKYIKYKRSDIESFIENHKIEVL